MSQRVRRRLDTVAGVVAAVALLLAVATFALVVYQRDRAIDTSIAETCRSVGALRQDIVEFLEKRPQIKQAELDEFRPTSCSPAQD